MAFQLTKVIRATAAVGGAFSKIKGNRHAFSIDDLSISYPHKPRDTVSVGVLLVVSILVPVVIISLICLVFVPGFAVAKGTPRPLIWRRKFWELHTGIMGLGVTLAGAFMVTEGLKDIYGKPRPDLLARCLPNLSKLTQYAVGGLGLESLGQRYGEAPVLVDWHICQQTDAGVLSDGFASFPSGHSSFSWAGMTYLTLFLCAKFAISIPFLAPTTPSGYSEESEKHLMGLEGRTPDRNRAAAPPIYLLVFAFVPLGAAFYISGSRWSDYRHHGFDILFGSLIGICFAWFGFRLYHLPIRRGAGWSWGARSRNRAFYIGLGVPSYVGDEGWDSTAMLSSRPVDLESGVVATGHGLSDNPEQNTLEHVDGSQGNTELNGYNRNNTRET